MAATGVNVCVESLGDRDAPSCPHGPTLLFERVTASGASERFYACSACRDRKQCSFYQTQGKRKSSLSVRVQEDKNQMLRPLHTQEEYSDRLRHFQGLQQHKRHFCQSCSLLLRTGELSCHKSHDLLHPITDSQLSSPTSLLTPLDCNKKNAQYLFSPRVVDVVVRFLHDLQIGHMLCIGTPRIHEAVCGRRLQSMRSLLLDMDGRLGQFYSADQFCRYNMFNHHFFDGESSQQVFTEFLTNEGSNKKMAIIVDPPFGGLVDVLAHTLNTITTHYKSVHQTEPVVLWFFPYFMERRVVAARPDLIMLDYKVDYVNHSSFCRKQYCSDKPVSGASDKGSPVRVFTNMAPHQAVLPAQEGYRLCEKCRRYVAPENRHCEACNACTSKNGRTYIHCEQCGRCVKPSYIHCPTCDTCILPDHTCGTSLSPGCHVCGDASHKRKECPQRFRAGPGVRAKRTHSKHKTVRSKKTKKRRH